MIVICKRHDLLPIQHFSPMISLTLPPLQNVAPFYVATAMSRMKFTNSLVMDANYYARSAVATIGIQSFTFGCLSHAIQVYTPPPPPPPPQNVSYIHLHFAVVFVFFSGLHREATPSFCSKLNDSEAGKVTSFSGKDKARIKINFSNRIPVFAVH